MAGWQGSRLETWKDLQSVRTGTFLLSVCFQRLPEDKKLFILYIKLPRLSPSSQWKDSTVNSNKSMRCEMMGIGKASALLVLTLKYKNLLPLSLLPLLLHIRVSKILRTFCAYKMKFTKRLL